MIATTELPSRVRPLASDSVKIYMVMAHSDTKLRVVCGYYASVLARRHADLANRRIRIYDLDPKYEEDDAPIYTVQSVPMRERVP
jgi:hypothetical protein